MTIVIRADNLSKIYLVPVREAGFLAAFSSLWKRQTRRVTAVDSVSFQVNEGEIVGFLGPNGAGKTTTLKMLSGLLHPTGGSARVFDQEPWQRDKILLRQITLVMGNRNQLVWDIPCADSFEVNRVIYKIPKSQYKETLDELVELLDLCDLLNKPVRNLSLGERMKCEIAGSLLHRPRVLFLDEPTIGLDIIMQRRIRSFVREYNLKHQATVLLTSHYMADVEALCRRVIIIHQGKLLFDGTLSDLVSRFAPNKTISLRLDGDAASRENGTILQYFARHGDKAEQKEGWIKIRVSKGETARVTARLLADLPVIDLTVEEPPIEEIIEQAFAVDGRS